MAEETKATAPQAQTPAPRQWTIGVRDDALAFKPRTWQEIYDFAALVCKTDFVIPDFRDKPGAVLAAWQTGYEVGLPPMASLKYIAVINGRTRIWGNAYWALVNAHPLCEWTEELPEHEALEKGYGECTVKRKGRKNPVTAKFTKEMAEQSGVWGGKGATQEKREQSVWFKRPGRMLQWMARNLAGNDAVPEATLGLEIAELAEDELRDVTPAERPIAIPKPLPEQPKEAKERADDSQGTTQGAGMDVSGDSGSESDNRRENPATGVTERATQEAANRDSQTDIPLAKSEEKKSLKLIALEEIAGFSKDTFPTPDWLNPYMKEVMGKDQAELCAAYNNRKTALGL